MGGAECVIDKDVRHRTQLLHDMGLFRILGSERQVLFGIEPDILEHDDIAVLCTGDRIAGMLPENAVHVRDRGAEELLQLPGMLLQGGEVLLARPALVGDDHGPGIRKGMDGGDVFTEPFVVEDVVRRGIDG